jgi:uncharacterized protein (TIGR00304 family)
MSDHGYRLTVVGILISVIGILTIFAGFIIGSLQTGSSVSSSFGGVVVIGPIPIVFGTDKTTVLIAVIGAVILMVVSVATMIVNSRRAKRYLDEAET